MGKKQAVSFTANKTKGAAEVILKADFQELSITFS